MQIDPDKVAQELFFRVGDSKSAHEWEKLTKDQKIDRAKIAQSDWHNKGKYFYTTTGCGLEKCNQIVLFLDDVEGLVNTLLMEYVKKDWEKYNIEEKLHYAASEANREDRRAYREYSHYVGANIAQHRQNAENSRSISST
jgi:hypothetical protein